MTKSNEMNLYVLHLSKVFVSTGLVFNVVKFCLWVSNLSLCFSLLNAAASFSDTNRRLPFYDDRQGPHRPHHLIISNSDYETTLIPDYSHEIIQPERLFQKGSGKRHGLYENAKVIRTENMQNMQQLKLIHRTSILISGPGAKYQASNSEVDVQLEELLQLDAIRLRSYRRFSSNKRPINSSGPLVNLTNAASDQRKKSSGKVHAEHPSESVDSRMFSGATVGSGQYFVELSFGTPPKRYLLIADTGSDLVWVQSYPCSSCFPQSNPVYNPHLSSSFSPVPCSDNRCLFVPAPLNANFCDFRSPTNCSYSYMYSDNSSTAGFLASDTVTMSSNSKGERTVKISNITFGCGTSNTGVSFHGSNGVLGLGQGPLSFASQVGTVFGNIFSYCLVDYLKDATGSSLLLFGEENFEQFSKKAIQYTPMLRNSFAESYYYVGIKQICVDGKILPISSEAWQLDASGYGGTIVDSGTTLTYFKRAAYALIVAAFRKAIFAPKAAPTQGLDVCYRFSSEADVQNIPQFSILLEGDALFQPPPANYFIDTASGVKCLAMQGVDSPLGSNTIGNLLQQNFYVEFDRSNTRLGFAWTNCSSTIS